MEDAAIIRRVQQGDTEAYAHLVRKYHRDLLGFIHRLVRDPHLAEDIGQEVFLDAYKAMGRFDADRGTPFMAWLCILARNRCVSVLRQRGREVLVATEQASETAADGPGLDERLMAKEERQALRDSLARLEEPFRSTIIMSLRGQPAQDIAEDLGLPLGTVKTRLFRAREKLRLSFRTHFGGIGCEHF